MNEYSRILIENYCRSHNSAKCRRLEELVYLSYDPACEVMDDDAIFLEKAINTTRDPEVRTALEDLDDYLFGC